MNVERTDGAGSHHGQQAPDARRRPLDGLRVVDLTRALAGPYATLLLAGLGAEVIKVEDPHGGDMCRHWMPFIGREGVTARKAYDDDITVAHLTRSRGKLGVSLNLKSPQSAEVFADLVHISDIVVENFSAGTADRLGVGYPVAQAANPRIIYCSISGFGADSGRGVKAMDIIIQALSGIMFSCGEVDEPPVRVGIPVADLLAPTFGVIGILAALHHREVTGRGQYVDISMLGALTSFVGAEGWKALEMVGMESRTGLRLRRHPPFGAFPCKDGYVALVAADGDLYQNMFRAVGQPELAQDSRFATLEARVAHSSEIEALVEGWSRTRTREEVVAVLEAEGIPCAPVRHPVEALSDPRVVARGETVAVSHPSYPRDDGLRSSGIPIVFSDARTGRDDVLPVKVGQNNSEIYGTLLGYSEEHLRELARDGVI